MLYSLRDKGIIEQVSRGFYRLVELPPMSNPDLVTVSLRFPNAVICLISALSYHNITTQIPHAVSVAVPRDSRVPSLDYGSAQESIMRIDSANIANELMKSIEAT
jgi:predicted transcriptional regulator of viral defense system